VTTFVLAAVAVAGFASQGAPDYRAIVHEYQTSPNTAVERILAMPQPDVVRAVRDAVRDTGRFTPADYAAALVMHGDIAIYFVQQHDPRAGSALDIADELASAAAREHGHAWFVHRWYSGFTAALKTDPRAKGLREHWRSHEWYRLTSALDHAIEYERDGTGVVQGLGPRGHPGVDREVYDAPTFRNAVPLLHQALDGGVIAAAVHLGRIQMLRGYETEARTLFALAAADQHSRIDRYLGNLFLGAIEERDGRPDVPEMRYRAASTALPGAQSGRLALASLLARYGRAVEAARLFSADEERASRFDPWWSFLSVEVASILAEVHAEVLE
jgi:hypothetical protein